MRLPLNPTWQRLTRALSAREPRRFLAEEHREQQSPPAEGPAPPPIWAAVAVIVAPDPDSLLLIRRAERTGDPWSGHIGLPGGRADPGDSDLQATAVRETAEEIGWSLDKAELLGELDDVWPRTPLPQIIVVRPFVFAVLERRVFAPSAEVADAFWVPLSQLQHPSIYRDTPLQVRGHELVFPAYHLSQGVVWGLTERILTPLLSLYA